MTKSNRTVEELKIALEAADRLAAQETGEAYVPPESSPVGAYVGSVRIEDGQCGGTQWVDLYEYSVPGFTGLYGLCCQGEVWGGEAQKGTGSFEPHPEEDLYNLKKTFEDPEYGAGMTVEEVAPVPGVSF